MRAARRVLLALAVLAGVWSLALKISGGIALETTWGLVSSRNPVRPLLAGAALLAWYLAVWRRQWRTDLGPLSDPGAWPTVIAALAIITALILGIGWGTRIAAGPDQSGYVSQAAMFARGELTMHAPHWARNAPWDDAAFSASPVGWHPGYETNVLVPTYAPGLPLILAAVEKTFGRDAVFYVVPVIGGVLVWSTYLLGSLLAGPWAGAIAAVLVVSSPTFHFMQQQVMSDVPVAAFLTVSVAAALHGRHSWLAGAAAAAAVLTRPNLVPLVLVPALLMLRGDRRLTRLAAFALPIAVACVIVAAINRLYHGSPLVSGYGPLGIFYSRARIVPNLRQYGRWYVELHTPLAFLGVLGVFVVKSPRWRIALATLAVPLALLALYMPFLLFDRNDWGYTRFLLPGYPAFFAGLGVAACAAYQRTPWRRVAAAATTVIVGTIAAHGWRQSAATGIFTQRAGDNRYARAVDYAKELPERSILVSNAHSGTLRLYTGRDVLRFEAIQPAEFDIAATELRRQGYGLVLIGDEFEIDQFRTRFAGTRAVATLPKKPRADLLGVAVYDLPP